MKPTQSQIAAAMELYGKAPAPPELTPGAAGGMMASLMNPIVIHSAQHSPEHLPSAGREVTTVTAPIGAVERPMEGLAREKVGA